MAGSSSITLFRSEDATITMQFQARQAAQTLYADLTSGTLRLLLKPYPDETPFLTLTPSAPVSGCILSLTVPEEGMASLFVPLAFLASRTEPQIGFEAFLDSPSGTQRLGEHIVDVTE